MDWTNWIIPDGFYSELAEELAVKAIPRYLLLDRKGRIANANAPRPSDRKALKSLLDQLISE